MNDDARSVAYGETWLEVVAAVEYLRTTHRPELTVWDALAEAVRWWVEDSGPHGSAGREPHNLPWHDPDPLRSALESLLSGASPVCAPGGHLIAESLDGALGHWVDTMSRDHNDDCRFRRRA